MTGSKFVALIESKQNSFGDNLINRIDLYTALRSTFSYICSLFLLLPYELGSYTICWPKPSKTCLKRPEMHVQNIHILSQSLWRLQARQKPTKEWSNAIRNWIAWFATASSSSWTTFCKFIFHSKHWVFCSYKIKSHIGTHARTQCSWDVFSETLAYHFLLFHHTVHFSKKFQLYHIVLNRAVSVACLIWQ